ncbi:MAG TPA: D-glycero-beta-D-manno-heptose 1-phosphate adenylyltransferase [Anaerolineae bacterium]|nr:D-glycero-beta-D-manno-heptose 1-phosphate adenylyltransferase [Anaerolineae bacterium]
MGRVVSPEEALRIREELRAAGKTVVLTNGHFDLLHLGHVRCLQQAKKLGDVLFVGVNSDASTRLLKGERRPIVPEDERARLVAALECVDYVVIFEERTARRLVELLKPDIYAKGGDYGPAGKELPEAEAVAAYGGEVRILPYLPGRSTTDIIRTILERYGGGT